MLMRSIRRSEPKQNFESLVTEFPSFPENWYSLQLSFIHTFHWGMRHNVACVKNKLLPKEENEESRKVCQFSWVWLQHLSLLPHHKTTMAPWCLKHPGITSFRTKWQGGDSAEAEIWTLKLCLARCVPPWMNPPSFLTLCLHVYSGESNSAHPQENGQN